MEEKAKPDFSGWATKAGLKCSDGRTIMTGAFKHQDQETVPLVWQHNHNTPDNVLGYALLEHREDGVYTYGFFNDTPQAKNAKMLVQHGDVKSLSIYANQLTERAKQVLHGMIREVSLVLSGANPGALIDNISIAHSDGEVVVLEDEAVIYTGTPLRHTEEDEASPVEEEEEAPDEEEKEKTPDEEEVEHAAGEKTVQEVFDLMTPEQKDVVNFMVGAAIENAKSEENLDHSDEEESEEVAHSDEDKEGQKMTKNVFEAETEKKDEQHVLTHSEMRGIVDQAKKIGSLKDAIEDYALAHGIENIDLLFPDARNVTDTPEFMARRVEWVAGVLNGSRHSPFSRIKSLVADLTFEEARAKGYIKGNLKKEEWFSVSRRVTTPATVYKKQKLDRDDILDITDFDVVVWLKAEMRMMFDEEIARAVLIGDGRDVGDDDKIKDPAGASEGAGIRSILHDHDLYAPTFTVDDTATGPEIADAITSALGFYKGSGAPTLYTTLPVLTTMLLTRDQFDHRLWRNKEELATELGVAAIVTVEVMEDETDLVGIVVNLRDYTIGSDKGGEVSFFDFFDIDYNQYKYLYEARLSGALTKIRSALVFKRAASGGTLATPTAPTFDEGTNVVTVPTVTGVVYHDKSDDSVISGAQSALTEGQSLTVEAKPDTGYYFANNIQDEWTFNYVAP
jgi:HK97 family phage prohead protease